MKATYISGAGEEDVTREFSDEIWDALRNLPIRAAGYALIGLFCPHDDIGIEFVRVEGPATGDGKPFSQITVTFGDRCEDVIQVNLA